MGTTLRANFVHRTVATCENSGYMSRIINVIAIEQVYVVTTFQAKTRRSR